MTVVKIRHMVVVMYERFVTVAVAVRLLRHRLMFMGVVPIVVAVGMFVFHGVVRMSMAVAFCRMEVNAREYQNRCTTEPEAEPALSQKEGDKCTDEWRDGKQRSGSRRTEGALGEQVKA